MREHAKAIAAFFGALATWGGTVAGDGVIDLGEWFGLAGVLATALAVYQVSNGPNGTEN